MSATDSALQSKSLRTGATYKSKDEAIGAFRSQNASKYPTKFSSEPSMRPNYVPKTTIVSGVSHSIIFSPMYGGYGYFVGPMWYPYSPLYDAAMCATLMNSSPGYAYGTFSVWYWMGAGLLAVLVIVFLFWLCRGAVS